MIESGNPDSALQMGKYMRRELVECELTPEGPSLVPGRGRPPAGRSTVTVNIAESPLAWLYAHGHLDHRLFAAGERLRSDYERAQLSPSITMRWDAVRIRGTSDSGLGQGERQMAARARFDGALLVAGRGLEDILWRVVCAGESLPVAEKALEWPARSGKLVLKLALDRVAAFYRIS